MVQDLLKTINALQNTAIGNCRKRIEDATARTKRIMGGRDSQDADEQHHREKPSHGVTSILKGKHGL
jgi:hypothetical protein